MVRTVASVAALKAINTSSGMTDGELRYLAGTDFNGEYKYVAASVLAESLPWVVAPTTGSGRWIHSLYSLVGAASGIATLSASSRVV